MDPGRHAAASDWFARLRSRSVTTAELNDFARWRRDPGNAAAYRAVETMWERAGGLADDPDVAASIGRARLRKGDRPNRLLGRIRLMAMVAAAALAVFIGVLIARPASQPILTTGKAQTALVRLDDGTRVQLDADTVVATYLDHATRRVRIDRGQAFFEVSHDPARPFVVEANGVSITALGTEFDVDALGDEIRVSLVVGSVEVRSSGHAGPVRLRPGESVLVSGGVIGRPVGDRASETTSWRAGRLTFRDTPLSQAVVAMNRYTDRPMRVGRGTRSGETVNGDFSTGDVDGFVRAVETLFGPGAVVREPGR